MNNKELNLLKGYILPFGYKTYNFYYTNKYGNYIIWSRDGKRFYLDGANKYRLLLLPDFPFKNITSAKNYLIERIKKNDKFGIKTNKTKYKKVEE